MKRYIFIGTGGFLGAILRYVIKNMHIHNYIKGIPLNTLIINITGSFVLAFILTAVLKIRRFDEDIKLGIATGFLGAFTTFSTMCKETVVLINQGSDYLAFTYILLSILAGLAMVYCGAALAQEVALKFVKTSHTS